MICIGEPEPGINEIYVASTVCAYVCAQCISILAQFKVDRRCAEKRCCYPISLLTKYRKHLCVC